jgi:type I restriction enzyme R subunit
MEQGVSLREVYIPQLFKFIQILISTNNNDTRYATCGTPKKFWSVWGEEDQQWLQQLVSEAVQHRLPTSQDKLIVSLFHPQRLLEPTQYYTLFE